MPERGKGKKPPSGRAKRSGAKRCHQDEQSHSQQNATWSSQLAFEIRKNHGRKKAAWVSGQPASEIWEKHGGEQLETSSQPAPEVWENDCSWKRPPEGSATTVQAVPICPGGASLHDQPATRDPGTPHTQGTNT